MKSLVKFLEFEKFGAHFHKTAKICTVDLILQLMSCLKNSHSEFSDKIAYKNWKKRNAVVVTIPAHALWDTVCEVDWSIHKFLAYWRFCFCLQTAYHMLHSGQISKYC